MKPCRENIFQKILKELPIHFSCDQRERKRERLLKLSCAKKHLRYPAKYLFLSIEKIHSQVGYCQKKYFSNKYS